MWHSSLVLNLHKVFASATSFGKAFQSLTTRVYNEYLKISIRAEGIVNQEQ